jgi:hypothetical protein
MKKLTMGLMTVGLIVAGTLLATGVASAYQGNPSVKGPNYTPERHEAMTKAFAANDYTAWASLMQGKGRATQVINKDNFAKFTEAHNLALEGKTDEAQKIRQELGLGLRNGTGNNGGGMGMHRNLNK